jgi:hypothetical protein
MYLTEEENKTENRKVLGWHLASLAEHLMSDDFEEYEYTGLTDLELAFNDYVYGIMAIEYAFEMAE